MPEVVACLVKSSSPSVLARRRCLKAVKDLFEALVRPWRPLSASSVASFGSAWNARPRAPGRQVEVRRSPRSSECVTAASGSGSGSRGAVISAWEPSSSAAGAASETSSASRRPRAANVDRRLRLLDELDLGRPRRHRARPAGADAASSATSGSSELRRRLARSNSTADAAVASSAEILELRLRARRSNSDSSWGSSSGRRPPNSTARSWAGVPPRRTRPRAPASPPRANSTGPVLAGPRTRPRAPPRRRPRTRTSGSRRCLLAELDRGRRACRSLRRTSSSPVRPPRTRPRARGASTTSSGGWWRRGSGSMDATRHLLTRRARRGPARTSGSLAASAVSSAACDLRPQASRAPGCGSSVDLQDRPA